MTHTEWLRLVAQVPRLNPVAANLARRIAEHAIENEIPFDRPIDLLAFGVGSAAPPG